MTALKLRTDVALEVREATLVGQVVMSVIRGLRVALAACQVVWAMWALMVALVLMEALEVALEVDTPHR